MVPRSIVPAGVTSMPLLLPIHQPAGKRLGGVTRGFIVGLLAGCLFALGLPRASSATEEPAGYDLHVFLSDGRPAAHALIHLRGPNGEMPTVAADAEGRARVEGLKHGDTAYFLAVSADGREAAFDPELVVPEGTTVLTLRLYPPCHVTGELLDEKGQPVAGAAVRVDGWNWVESYAPMMPATTDAKGEFRINGLLAGAHYKVLANEGSAEKPVRTWSSHRFTIFGWDAWHNAGIMLPDGSEAAAPRPEGKAIAMVVSGTDDEWLDAESGQWHPAVETSDPNRDWAPAPDGAVWIWKAGRPDAASERLGATVEFRRSFTVPEGVKVTGYLMVGADDYAAIRVNGQWVGQTNDYYRLAGIVIPGDLLRPGANELRITLRNIAMTSRDIYNPTGVAYELELIGPEG